MVEQHVFTIISPCNICMHMIIQMTLVFINFKIVCRCFGNNLFKEPNDDDLEGLVSSLGTLEDAMLSLPMAYY